MRRTVVTCLDDGDVDEYVLMINLIAVLDYIVESVEWTSEILFF